MKSVSIIIPARFKSSRFPGKPLKKIFGKEMVIRVAEKCKKVIGIKNLYIATDDIKIVKIAKKNNFKTILTPRSCKTGTDRISYAAKKINSKIIVNVQGDEPLIKTGDIKKVIKLKKKYPDYVICGYAKIKDNKEINNPNVIKLVKNSENKLIYFSRSKIPLCKKNKNRTFHKQVCVYSFNKKQLLKFSKAKRSSIEKIEDIELLRFLDLDIKIKMCKVSSTTAVDLPSDIKKVEKILKKMRINS